MSHYHDASHAQELVRNMIRTCIRHVRFNMMFVMHRECWADRSAQVFSPSSPFPHMTDIPLLQNKRPVNSQGEEKMEESQIAKSPWRCGETHVFSKAHSFCERVNPLCRVVCVSNVP